MPTENQTVIISNVLSPLKQVKQNPSVVKIETMDTPIKTQLRQEEARRIAEEADKYPSTVEALSYKADNQSKPTTHWQRNRHRYYVMAVVILGAAIAVGLLVPAVGSVLIGAATIASLSPALSTAIAWAGIVAAPVLTLVSGWGLSKLFGMTNEYKGFATASVEPEQNALSLKRSANSSHRLMSDRLGQNAVAECPAPSIDAAALREGEHETASSRSSRSSSRISSLPGRTTFMPRGRIEFSDSESCDEGQEVPGGDIVVLRV